MDSTCWLISQSSVYHLAVAEKEPGKNIRVVENCHHTWCTHWFAGTNEPWLLTFCLLLIVPVTQDKLATFTSFFSLSFAVSWTSVSVQTSLLVSITLSHSKYPPITPSFPVTPFSSLITISSSMLIISRSLLWAQMTWVPDSTLHPYLNLYLFILEVLHQTCSTWSCNLLCQPAPPLMIPTSVIESMIYPLVDTLKPKSHPLFLFLPYLPHAGHYQALTSQPLQYS